MFEMNLIKIKEKVFEKFQLNKRNENLIQMGEDENTQLIIVSRLFRRKFSSIYRYLIYLFLIFPLFLYLLIILTPIANLKSLIPNEITKHENFLLVIAHPDDECLFFSPTILGLLSRGKKGHILSLTNGNSNGLGYLREKELKQSCQILGIQDSKCFSLNLTDFQDNSSIWWTKESVSLIVDKYVTQLNIDLLITFDSHGISNHINHKSISYGIEYYISTTNKSLLAYQLSTVSILFKFSSILNILPTIITFLPRLFQSLFSTIFPFIISSPPSERVLFVSSPFGYVKGLQAFHAHRSQVVWFRHLYTTFSRYMFINHLKQIKSH